MESQAPQMTYWHEGLRCCNARWEEAYRRFETSEQEVAKFRRRMQWAGLTEWDQDRPVADLFCGRGSGLVALEQLGFRNLAGVDLSPDLLGRYRGAARTYVGDCRDLKFEPGSLYGVTIQGGLHHLPRLPEDLVACLDAVHRSLARDGRVFICEPWRTPFLQVAHFCCCVGLFRRLYGRLDALAVMIEEERESYMNWLARPAEIMGLLEARFRVEKADRSGGKLMYVGRPR